LALNAIRAILIDAHAENGIRPSPVSKKLKKSTTKEGAALGRNWPFKTKYKPIQLPIFIN
jgi:hypothetical protein